MRRKPGQASVEEHPRGSGRWRVRARVNGALRTLASGLTRADAEEVAAAHTETRNARELVEGVTLSAFGVGFLARRERAGVRSVQKDRARWSRYIDRDPIGVLPVATLRRRDILEWLDRWSGLAHQTRKNALNLFRVALQEAVDRELLEQNPARDVRVHKAAAARATDGLEGVLLPQEQQALIAAIPERQRAVVVFALCTGLRQAEQWWLKWSDVQEDRVLVRRSVGGLPPKGGRPREVFLLPPAKAALASLRRRSEWVFPAARGGRRQQGKAPRQWQSWLRAAGITRRVRWHDLRHTCATSLLAGWWGRKWSLDEVCRFMGHSSVNVTERYARKLSETQALAVAATPGLMFPGGNTESPNHAKRDAEPSGFLNRWSQIRILPGAQQVSRRQREHRGNNESASPATWSLALAAERVLRRKGGA